jgi:hypothetical protein
MDALQKRKKKKKYGNEGTHSKKRNMYSQERDKLGKEVKYEDDEGEKER